MLPQIGYFFALIICMGVMTPHTARAQTGDSLVDAQLSGYTQKAGNILPAVNLDPNSYVLKTGCSSSSAPAWEENCPSDLTYAPAYATGGYQAFGVAVSPVEAGWREEWYAYWVLVLDDCWENCTSQTYHWEVYWELEFYYVPASTVGTTVSRVAWGNMYTATYAGLFPLTTLAFKSASNHPPGESSVECEPSRVYGLGDTSPCAPWKDDAFIIPVATGPGVGFEGKINIPNPLCSPLLLLRTDTVADADAGCFWNDGGSWYSSLPGGIYRDTPKFDTAPTYVASVGTVTPWLIQEGFTYYWSMNFYALGTHHLVNTGLQAKHFAAVTWKTPNGFYPCPFGGGAPLCQYVVDQTLLGPGSWFYPSF